MSTASVIKTSNQDELQCKDNNNRDNFNNMLMESYAKPQIRSDSFLVHKFNKLSITESSKSISTDSAHNVELVSMDYVSFNCEGGVCSLRSVCRPKNLSNQDGIINASLSKPDHHSQSIMNSASTSTRDDMMDAVKIDEELIRLDTLMRHTTDDALRMLYHEQYMNYYNCLYSDFGACEDF